MLNLQTDLETLGLDDDAVIVQIGAVIYDDESWEVKGKYDRYLSMSEQIVNGRTITPSTVDFWSKERAEGRVTEDRWHGLFSSSNPPGEVAREFAAWIEQFEGPIRFWSNHLMFDASKLNHFFVQYDLKPYKDFTKYNLIEDLATLKFAVLARDPVKGRELIDWLYQENKALVHHNALDDCIFQMNSHKAYIDFLKG